LQAANHWSELTQGQLQKILSPGNLFLLWLIYPLLKIVHELGHGLFTKVWGGNVHEWGIVFMLGTPLPYVDASSSIAFPSKSKRLMVSAAGMAVELFFAAIALLLWINVQDGLFRDLLFNIIIIGSVSTLFFNGNPLMRYDGYHLLTEAFDWPNLGTRSNQQLHYVVRRFGYGEQQLVMPAVNKKQGAFFVGYSLAAFAYRLVILLAIILLVAQYFPKLALLLAGWLIFFQLALPAIKYFYQLSTSKQLAQNKKRALIFSSGCSALLLLIFVAVPLPLSTSAEGLLWLPEETRVKAESTGEVVAVQVKDGDRVQKGQLLVQLSNSKMMADLTIKQATLREYEARYQQTWADNRSQAQLFAEDIAAIQAEIELLQKRVDNLAIRSNSAGTFRQLQTHELLGSFIQQGDSLA
ncbi:MAG: biotin/lipoyl-binding protein, partial [Moraxellaceae bacterium]